MPGRRCLSREIDEIDACPEIAEIVEITTFYAERIGSAKRGSCGRRNCAYHLNSGFSSWAVQLLTDIGPADEAPLERQRYCKGTQQI